MPKVVTSGGLNEFVSTGKPTEDIARVSPKGQSVRAVQKTAEATPPEKVPEVEEAKVDAKPDEGDEPPVLSEDSRKYVNKQHRLRKEAEEEAKELERLAEQQYNRAMLAEKRAAELESRLTAEAPKVEPKVEQKAPEQNDPKYRNEKGDFDWVLFTNDTAEFRANTAVREFQKQQEEERRTAAAAEARKVYESRIEDARKVHADYDDVVPQADIHTHRAVLDYVFFDSKVPGQIAYHLAKNPDFLKQLNSMSPTAAVAEIGALAKTFEKPKANGAEAQPEVTRRSSGAPPPITPLDTSSSGTVNTDPSKMSFKELRRFERQRLAKQRGH